MKPNAENIKCAPLRSAREVAAMLKQLSRDERLRIEGAITWASMAHTGRQQDSA